MVKDRIFLELKVIPQASHNKVDSMEEKKPNYYKIKLRVTASPTDGKANEAVVRLLSDFLGVSRSCVTITAGWTSRQKKAEITGCDITKLCGNLQLSLC